MPPDDWLASLPRVLRVQVIAHLVQQSADTGDARTHALIEPQAERLLDHPLADSADCDLRLRGAMARLHAVTGRAATALDAPGATRPGVRGHLCRRRHRLPAVGVGAAGGRAGRRARRWRVRRPSTRGCWARAAIAGSARASSSWPSRAGRLLLDPADSDGLDAARQLAADEALPDHVRWCATPMARRGGPRRPRGRRSAAAAVAAR